MTDNAVWPGWQVAWGRLIQSGIYRGLRAGLFTFVGIIIATWQGLGTEASGLTTAFEQRWDFALGAAILAAITALGWRTLLDPLGIPSLKESPIPVQPGPNAIAQPILSTTTSATPPRVTDVKPLGPGGV